MKSLFRLLLTATCILLMAVPALPHAGGTGGAGTGGTGGGSAGGNVMGGFTSTDASFGSTRGQVYTHYSQGIHDDATANAALNAWERADNHHTKTGKEQFAAIMVSGAAWNGKHPPKVSQAAMALEAMIAAGAIKPSQALKFLMIYAKSRQNPLYK